jgi:hypothetical protein
MTPETVALSWWSEPLIWAASDCETKKVLDEALSLLAGHPEIVHRIEADQDAVAHAKKKVRQADRRWQAAQTLSLPGVSEETVRLEAEKLTLEQGRPRMKPEVVYVFMVLRGYWGSIGDQEARDRLLDSTTLQLYLHQRGEVMPGWTTILENVNAVSNTTRSFILDAQLAMILDEGLDDFSQVILDSTAVEANSAWPTDARILLGLLERAFASSQKLEAFALSNIPAWWVPQWLKKLRKLLFKINNATGKRGSKGRRKKHYRQFFHNTAKILDHLIPHCVERDPVQEAVAQRPSRRALLTRLWERLVEDVCDACAVFHYAEERIFEDKVRPAAEKLLSLVDGEAAYIEKGGREAVIGYKPQLARSSRGFVPALIVPEGNAADSTQLVPLVQQIQERTGVMPQDVSTDDGFTSEEGRDKLLAAGVEQVSFSGSNGKKLLSEEIWNDPAYVEARRQRSAVESLIFTLKHAFAFGRLRRRGREEVCAELLEKVIAYHFSRMLLVRLRKTAA